MKRLIVLLLIVGFMLAGAGCSKEFLAHDTLYKTNDHMFFSWWGYRDSDVTVQAQSNEEGWWGDCYTIGKPGVPCE